MRNSFIALFALVGTSLAVNVIIQLTKDVSLNKFTNDFFKQYNKRSKLYEKYFIGQDFKAFSADLNQEQLEALYQDPKVAAISMRRQLQPQEYLIQSDVPEHLQLLMSATHLPRFSFKYDSTAGNGVDMYIFDSGIASSQVSFSSLTLKKLNVKKSKQTCGSDKFINGHGTAVAGLVASDIYGVLKKCNLIDVNIMGSTGSVHLTTVLRALNLVVNQIRETKRPSVIVFPYSMPKNAILNSAIENIPDTIPVVLAAGNQDQSACNFSPASARKGKNIIVVGSISSENPNNKADFSNYGYCVDIFTSGENVITIADPSNEVVENQIGTFSGTSASCAITAGVIGYYMSLGLIGADAIQKAKDNALWGNNRSFKILKMT